MHMMYNSHDILDNTPLSSSHSYLMVALTPSPCYPTLHNRFIVTGEKQTREPQPNPDQFARWLMTTQYDVTLIEIYLWLLQLAHRFVTRPPTWVFVSRCENWMYVWKKKWVIYRVEDKDRHGLQRKIHKTGTYSTHLP